MGATTIKFHGVQEEILNRIVDSGIAETKSETIRMALMHFALEMKIINDKMLLEVIRDNLKTDRKTAAGRIRNTYRVQV